MKIVLPKYLAVASKIIPSIHPDKIEKYDNIIFNRGPIKDEKCFNVAWGSRALGAKGVGLETGFFWAAGHVDTLGLYANSSLNTPAGLRAIEQLNASISAREIVNESPVNSKYRQTKNDIDWRGVVLALQNPGDRSIHSSVATEDYFDFVQMACRYYGKHLFLKAHPWNSGPILDRLKAISDKYGCCIAKTNHSILKHCRFVLTFNSSFAVDCFIRDVPVVQYAPGYFFQTGAVKYTGFEFTDEPGDTIEQGRKVANFLVWKYCINLLMDTETWVGFLISLSESNELFPVEDKYCYANNLPWSTNN